MGEVAVGGSWAVGAVVLAIDIFVRVVGGVNLGGRSWRRIPAATFSQR